MKIVLVGFMVGVFLTLTLTANLQEVEAVTDNAEVMSKCTKSLMQQKFLQVVHVYTRT